jgi:hypothetical protein
LVSQLSPYSITGILSSTAQPKKETPCKRTIRSLVLVSALSYIHSNPCPHRHFRRIPAIKGESSNPLSSAFASSNNLSKPLFFSCVYHQMPQHNCSTIVIETWGRGGYLDARAIFVKDCLTCVHRPFTL